jgi:hypothetical protein
MKWIHRLLGQEPRPQEQHGMRIFDRDDKPDAEDRFKEEFDRIEKRGRELRDLHQAVLLERDLARLEDNFDDSRRNHPDRSK